MSDFRNVSWSRQQMMAQDAAKPKRKLRDKIKSTLFPQLVAGSEDEIQATFFDWVFKLEGRYPILKRMHSIPNGGKRSGLIGYILKITGMRPGVLDTFLPFADSGHIGLWIEFKTPTGSVSKEQKEWIDYLRQAGYQVEVCRSWIQAANVVIDYLQLPLVKFKE